MADAGVILGLGGIVTGIASLLYAHGQVRAARSQAQQAAHMTLLGTNQHLFERLHSARERVGNSPRLLGELRAVSPAIDRAIEESGGFSDYILLREVMELFQDAYFMRRDGLVTDAYWVDLTGNAAFWARLPSFAKVFEFAADAKLLHPEFVAFFRPITQGKPGADPRST